MHELPVNGLPIDVIRILKNYISDFIKKRMVIEFHIGRTGHLPEALGRHESDVFLPPYKTNSLDNAIEVEKALIKTFLNHQKWSIEVSDGGGGASGEYTNYVYIAVWYA